MAARSLPPIATKSRLDWSASALLKAASQRPNAASVTQPVTRLARPRLALTYLADMLTPERNSFGVIRLLLAVAVLISHAVYLTTARADLEPLYRWTNYTLGQHGVQGFFFLSGILVAQSLFASRSIKDFAIARSLRIFPALIVCVLATALILGPWLSTLPTWLYLKDQGVAAYIVKTLTLTTGSAELPGLFQDNPLRRVVNTSVWTLKYEAACYVLLALAGFVVLRLNAWREAVIALVGVWLCAVLYAPAGLEIHGGQKSSLDVIRYFALFFGTGVLAYAGRQYLPVHGLALVPLAALATVAVGTRLAEPALALVIGYAILWLATFRFGGLRTYTNSNDYSYGTYLLHMPVSQAILHFWPGLNVLSLILATAGIVLVLAFLSWEFVERPALRLRHRLADSDAQAPVVVAADVEPGRARVWRPTPGRQRLTLVTDAVPPTAFDAQVETAVAAAPPAVSASRMAFVTNRAAAPVATSVPTVDVENVKIVRTRPNWIMPTDSAAPQPG